MSHAQVLCVHHLDQFDGRRIAFVDLDGNEVYRHLGMIRTAEELLLLGEYIEGKHHYGMEFKTYSQQRGMRDKEDILITPAGESE